MHDADGDPLTGESFYTKYATDAGEALRIFAATAARVYLVGTPISRRAAEAHGPNAGRLNARYSEIADLAGAGYIDAGAAVLDHDQLDVIVRGRPAPARDAAADHSLVVERGDDDGQFRSHRSGGRRAKA